MGRQRPLHQCRIAGPESVPCRVSVTASRANVRDREAGAKPFAGAR